MRYFWILLLILFRHGFLWWSTLVVTYLLGVGFFAEYSALRIKLGDIGQILPAELMPIWIIIPFLLWLIVSMSHKEVMRNLWAGKIVVDGPVIIPRVPLSTALKNVEAKTPTTAIRVQTGENDIVSVMVRNRPFDMSSGKSVNKAYGSVSIFHLKGAVAEAMKGETVLEFDNARWTNNQKPGYEDSPKDRYPDEWNFRTLEPNDSPNRLDFLLKTRDEENAYGFRGISQRVFNWHDPELELKPGRYLVRLSIMGSGMSAPHVVHYELEQLGAGKELQIRETKKRDRTSWLKADISA